MSYDPMESSRARMALQSCVIVGQKDWAIALTHSHWMMALPRMEGGIVLSMVASFSQSQTKDRGTVSCEQAILLAGGE